MRTCRSTVFLWVFVAGTVLASGWLYGLRIVPLQQLDNDSLQRNLRQRLEFAGKTIHEIKELEQETARARGKLNGLHGVHPEGSALVWLPNRVREHFAHFGIEVTVIRLNAIQAEAGLPGFQRVYWGVGLPIGNDGKDLTGLLLAVAELEREHRHLKVLDFAIRPDVENPLLRTAAINIAALVHK